MTNPFVESTETTVYTNRYYEKKISSGVVTAHYYLVSQQIAVMNGGTLSYIQQDHLSGTAVVSDSTGSSTGTIRYLPFGGRLAASP